MAFPQDKTILQVTTPFDPDALLLVRLHGKECISSPYRFDLEMVSVESSLDFATILGKDITVRLALSDGKFRYFNGIVTRFVQTGRMGKLTTYHAEMHPKFWLLGKTRNSCVFQKKTVPEIVKIILSNHGVTPVKDSLKGSYSAREYCVQYEESDLDFVSRLLEDEGIFYYFKHEDKKHTLVLADSSDGLSECENLDKARLLGEVGDSHASEDIVVTCAVEKQVIVGSYAVSDYNFETPTTPLLASVDGADPAIKMYEYPGNHAQKSAGEHQAMLRLEAEEALRMRVTGDSYVRAFSAGHTFALEGHDRSDANTEYVVLSVSHLATGQEYTNTFEGIPKCVTYRPPRTTPRPFIYGGQTAVVTGKSGDEIHTDQYGRIKIHFFWDRLGDKDEKSSCWVRVAQGWAGNTWGALFLPRVGQEVVVTFLGGDPDRPLVTGSVYNAEQKVPYPLPDEMTKSTIKTRSTKEGSHGNELRFEDKKDNEEVYLHAEKDQNFSVKHDFATEVGHDMTTTVKKGNRETTIKKGNDTLTVSEGNRTVTVKKGDETHSVKGKRDLTVEDDETHTSKSKLELSVKKDYTITVEGDLVIDCKGSVTIKSGKSLTINSKMDMTCESGVGFNCKAGTDFTCKSSLGLNLSAGTTLAAKGSVSATLEGTASAAVKGGAISLG